MVSLLFRLHDSNTECKVHELSFHDNKTKGPSIALTFKIIYVRKPVSLAIMCYFSQTLQHFYRKVLSLFTVCKQSNFISPSLTPYIMLVHEMLIHKQ